jgi:hypothetical protein
MRVVLTTYAASDAMMMIEMMIAVVAVVARWRGRYGMIEQNKMLGQH